MAVSKAVAFFPCSVEQLWQVATDLYHTNWRSDLAEVEILDDVHFVEHTKSGYATRFTITDCEPLRFWAFTMENGNMTGAWEGIFESGAGGSRLTCTETVAAKHWWMHPFVPGYLKRQQRLYLNDLRKALLP